MSDLFGGKAHARREDPETSHEAADSVTPALRQLQAKVADYAKRRGRVGFTDAQMSNDLNDPGSTLRTRRSEMTARNIIVDSGERRTFGDSARQRIVWKHRDFVPGAPPICEPPTPPSDEDRAEGRDMAIKLAEYAASQRKEGRAMFADELVEAAAIMKKLSA